MLCPRAGQVDSTTKTALALDIIICILVGFVDIFAFVFASRRIAAFKSVDPEEEEQKREEEAKVCVCLPWRLASALYACLLLWRPALRFSSHSLGCCFPCAQKQATSAAGGAEAKTTVDAPDQEEEERKPIGVTEYIVPGKELVGAASYINLFPADPSTG